MPSSKRLQLTLVCFSINFSKLQIFLDKLKNGNKE
tara:strand:- start:1668 stop:1772 length:105 start_codon:yes stop_codon:yes gene_type:complete